MDGILWAGIQLKGDDKPLIEVNRGARGARANAQNAKRVMSQVAMGPNEKKCFVHEKQMYSVVCSADGNKFLVVTPEDFPRLTVFEGLDKMKTAFGLYKSDMVKLDEEMTKIAEKYSDRDANKVRAVQKQVDDVKAVMIDNIDKALERGAKIEDVCAETGRLVDEADKFQTGARQIKYQMWKKRIVFIIAGLVLFLVVAFIVILLACRDSSSTINWNKCKSK